MNRMCQEKTCLSPSRSTGLSQGGAGRHRVRDDEGLYQPLLSQGKKKRKTTTNREPIKMTRTSHANSRPLTTTTRSIATTNISAPHPALSIAKHISSRARAQNKSAYQYTAHPISVTTTRSATNHPPTPQYTCTSPHDPTPQYIIAISILHPHPMHITASAAAHPTLTDDGHLQNTHRRHLYSACMGDSAQASAQLIPRRAHDCCMQSKLVTWHHHEYEHQTHGLEF
ncbi:hypothetical protein BDV95DRAFT_596481 [Massariosphaeria phaeospora]|uniref:Uncharacterized protein n=1 Tax=Massariosphaeria phaeospora TaxID=100035 RepID=A0A7C8MHC4_9PLEO|nr:hypothetical protein BDV95DRAFT_596481 [Massariosphaeria phaeospora]